MPSTQTKVRLKKRVLAKCPVCEKLYMAYTDWTGNVMPRIVHKSCRITNREIFKFYDSVGNKCETGMRER